MTRARYPSYLEWPHLHILYMSITDPAPGYYTAPGLVVLSQGHHDLGMAPASHVYHAPDIVYGHGAPQLPGRTGLLCVTPPEKILCPLAESFFKTWLARWLV